MLRRHHADILRQAGMGRRVDLLHPHRLANREHRRCHRLAFGRSAAPDDRDDVLRRHRIHVGFGRRQHLAGLDFLARNQFAFDHQRLEPCEPDLKIALAEIIRRRTIFAREARHVDVPAAGARHRHRQRKRSALPVAVKHRFVRLGHDGAKPLGPAHVMRTVHQAASPGCFGRPVPIMLSRVTSSASCSALQPSVPLGRIGSTR